MLKGTVCLILASVFLCGCVYKHIDSMTQFMVLGEVFDGRTGTPLDRVKVAFADVGIDSGAKRRHAAKEIGESDSNGRINLAVKYWWGAETGLFSSRSRMIFEVELSKEHHKTKRLRFDMAELVEKDDKLQVDLKKIYLEPE